MAKYTIEDVEILRQKSGISYEEAVNLLEYHNGSLARALVDLEKNGRLKSEKRAPDAHKGLKGVFDFLYRLRLKVRKSNCTIVNLSALFLLVVLFTAPHICIIGLLAALALGYRISVERDSREFATENFDDVIRNAKENVQRTVSGFSRQFSQNAEQDAGEEQRPRTESAPSGTRPVNVPFADGGRVNVRESGDGYHEADIR